MKQLAGEQEQVHHRVIELYEVEDVVSVSATTVAQSLQGSVAEVEEVMQELEQAGLLVRGSDGEVIYAMNNGYFPLAEG